MTSRTVSRKPRTRSDSEKSIATSLTAVLQPAGLRLQAGGIERVEQRELRTYPRQLPAEEIAAGGELAPMEVRFRSAHASESARRRQGLAQPHPRHHHVPE